LAVLGSITGEVVVALNVAHALAVRDRRTQLAHAPEASLLTGADQTVVAVGVDFAVEKRALIDFFEAEFFDSAGYVSSPAQIPQAKLLAVTEEVGVAISVGYALLADAPVPQFEADRLRGIGARFWIHFGLANANRIASLFTVTEPAVVAVEVFVALGAVAHVCHLVAGLALALAEAFGGLAESCDARLRAVTEFAVVAKVIVIVAARGSHRAELQRHEEG